VGELLVALLGAPAAMVAMLGLQQLERRLLPATERAPLTSPDTGTYPAGPHDAAVPGSTSCGEPPPVITTVNPMRIPAASATAPASHGRARPDR
jgi:hypothetical protein